MIDSRTIRRVVFAFAISLTGCGDDGVTPVVDAGSSDLQNDAFTGDPSLEIGTGPRLYVPLTDGQTVPLVRGIQGGFHIWGGLRGENFDPFGVQLEYSLVQDGDIIGGASYFDNLNVVDGGLEYGGVAVIIDPEPESVADRITTMSIRLTTRDGAVLTDSIDVIPDCCF